MRKKTEGNNFLRLSSRLDAVASRIQTAITMKQVAGSMGSLVKGLDSAMRSMDLEKVVSAKRGIVVSLMVGSVCALCRLPL